jgi:hypothetical protein
MNGVSGDNMRNLVALFLSLPALANAGGDYVSGKVRGFSGDDGEYSFTFAPDGRLVGFEGCQSFTVNVTYERVPWYSWLPFMHTNHPSKAQTKFAAELLRKAEQSSEPILFGYLGYGLVPSTGHCTFKSKGLALEHDADREFVISYHDQA